MKFITTFIVFIIINGSAFARGGGDLDRMAFRLAAPKEPVVHEMAISKVPALSTQQSKSLALAGLSGSGITTKQVIDWGGQCLWHDDDIDVDFGIPSIPGYTMVSAKLSLNYADADFNDVSVWDEPEVDIVGIGDSSFSLEVLKGTNGSASTTSWNVLNQIENDSASGSLGFQVNIDALHNNSYWCLVVKTATLTTYWK
ncbi:MAG: hypothetical protein L3J59_05045 [Methylococcaceae bacterium]|nr:hypothetical protein [Methylococcaceae bacterium]